MFKAKSSFKFLKLFCSSLMISFFAQQVAFAAPSSDISWIFGRSNGMNVVQIPESIAMIEDRYVSSRNAPMVYLLQDAHTNASGQFNMAKTIDYLIKKKGVETVYTEAADGEVALVNLKSQVSPDVMKSETTALVRKGFLHASEYLALTGEVDFQIMGVEDRSLYDEGLLLYEEIMSERPKALAYLKTFSRTSKILKRQIYSNALMKFDEMQSGYLKDKLSITDYVSGLFNLVDVADHGFKSITTLEMLRGMEESIDFESASRSQHEILMRLPSADQDQLFDMLQSSAKKIGGREDRVRNGFYALLREKSADILSDYPEFEKYLNYVTEAKKINMPEVLTELKVLEDIVASKLIKTEDQRMLLRFSESLRILESLWSMKIDPITFDKYRKNKNTYSTKLISGFFNKKIMEAEEYFEHAVPADKSFELNTEKIEKFYQLTHQRDSIFIERMISKMNDKNERSAILVAGGFHAPNLKKLLKYNGYSYTSITPQVIHETNYLRYESLLLSQIHNTDLRGDNAIESADKWMTLNMDAPSTNVSSPVFSKVQLRELLRLDASNLKTYPTVAASRLALFGDPGAQSDQDKAELLSRIRSENISYEELRNIHELLTNVSKETSDAVIKRFRIPVSEEKTIGSMFGLTSHKKQIALSKQVAANQSEVLDALNSRWIQVAQTNLNVFGESIKALIVKGQQQLDAAESVEDLTLLHEQLTGLTGLASRESERVVQEGDSLDGLLIVDVGQRVKQIDPSNIVADDIKNELISTGETLINGLRRQLFKRLTPIIQRHPFIWSRTQNVAELDALTYAGAADYALALYVASLENLSNIEQVERSIGPTAQQFKSNAEAAVIESRKKVNQVLPQKGRYLEALEEGSNIDSLREILRELRVVIDILEFGSEQGEIYRLESMIVATQRVFKEYFEKEFVLEEAVEKYHQSLSLNAKWFEGALEAEYLQYPYEIERGYLFTDFDWMVKIFDPKGASTESEREDLRAIYLNAQQQIRELFNASLLAPMKEKYGDSPEISEVDRMGEVLHPLVARSRALNDFSKQEIEWFLTDLRSNTGQGADIPAPIFENDQISNIAEVESALKRLYYDLHVLRELKIFTTGVVPAENPWSDRHVPGARLASLESDASIGVLGDSVDEIDVFTSLIENVSEDGLLQSLEEFRLLRFFAARVKRDRQYAVLWDNDRLSSVDVVDSNNGVEIHIQGNLVDSVGLNQVSREYAFADLETQLAEDGVVDALNVSEKIKESLVIGAATINRLTENRKHHYKYGFHVPVSRLFDFESIRDRSERESASEFLLSIMEWASQSEWGGADRVAFHIPSEELDALPKELQKFWSRAVETHSFLTSEPLEVLSRDYIAIAWIVDESFSMEGAVNIKMPKLRRGEMPLNFSNGVTMALEVFLTVVPDSKNSVSEAKKYFAQATSGLGNLLPSINQKLTSPFANEVLALEAFQRGRYGVRQTLKTGLVKLGEYLRSLRLILSTVRIAA